MISQLTYAQARACDDMVRYFPAISTYQILQRYGFKDFPYDSFEFAPDQGTCQLKTETKWLTPQGSSLQAGWLGNTWEIDSDTIVMTEGAGKLLAIEQAEHRALALYGVANWSQPRTDDEKAQRRRRVLHPQIKAALNKVVKVYLGFDNDCLLNPNVGNELKLLAMALSEVGCDVRVMLWDGPKGLDDLLATLPREERAEKLNQLKTSAVGISEFISLFRTAQAKFGEEILAEGEDVVPVVAKLMHAYVSNVTLDKASGVEYVLRDGYWVEGRDKNVIASDAWLNARSRVFFMSEDRKTGRETKVLLASKGVAAVPKLPATDLNWPNGQTFNQPYVLRFENGLYDLRARTLKKDTETLSHTCPYVLPEATLPAEAEEYLRLTFGDAQRVRAILRYLIDPTVGGGRIVHIHGASGSGKSTLLGMLAKMLNPREISQAFEFRDLNSQERAYNLLYGKRVMICPDVDTRLGSISLLLEISGSKEAGIQPIQVRPLHKKAIEIESYTKVCLASVSPLQLEGGADDGLARRLLTLSSTVSPDAAVLCSSFLNCAPQLMAWVLSMPMGAVHRYVYAPISATTVYNSAVQINPVFQFVDSVCQVGEGQIRVSQLFTVYKHWAQESNLRPVSLPTFKARLRSRLGVDCIQTSTFAQGRADWIVGYVPQSDRIAHILETPAMFSLDAMSPGGLAPKEEVEVSYTTAELVDCAPVEPELETVEEEIVAVDYTPLEPDLDYPDDAPAPEPEQITVEMPPCPYTTKDLRLSQRLEFPSDSYRDELTDEERAMVPPPYDLSSPPLAEDEDYGW